MDFSDLLYKEFAKSNYSVPLNKHDSFSSVSTADSPQSESPREGSSPSYKSKHQSNLERRHKNFQVKKKTEVINDKIKTFFNDFFVVMQDIFVGIDMSIWIKMFVCSWI